MTSLYRLFEPAAPAVPLLVDVPHAGELEPADLSAELLAPFELRKRDFDLYVDRFWADAPGLGAWMQVANFNRYVVDLNREATDVDAGSVLGHPNPVGSFRRGLLWQVTAAGEPVMGAPLAPEVFAERVANYHAPYHARLLATLEQLKAQFGFAVLIDGHSMPSVGRADHADPGVRRADIVPGTNRGQACDPTLVALCTDVFSAHGFSVRVDDPYKGGWITRHYGQPARQQHALQLEVNRDVYMDEATFEVRPHGLERLRRACAEFVAAAGRWRPADAKVGPLQD